METEEWLQPCIKHELSRMQLFKRKEQETAGMATDILQKLVSVTVRQDSWEHVLIELSQAQNRSELQETPSKQCCPLPV